jgi:hypothetical protein
VYVSRCKEVALGKENKEGSIRKKKKLKKFFFEKKSRSM